MDQGPDGTRYERDGDSSARDDVTRAASRYPLWLIVVGVVVFALALLFLGTMLLPGAATGP